MLYLSQHEWEVSIAGEALFGVCILHPWAWDGQLLQVLQLVGLLPQDIFISVRRKSINLYQFERRYELSGNLKTNHMIFLDDQRELWRGVHPTVL